MSREETDRELAKAYAEARTAKDREMWSGIIRARREWYKRKDQHFDRVIKIVVVFLGVAVVGYLAAIVAAFFVR